MILIFIYRGVPLLLVWDQFVLGSSIPPDQFVFGSSIPPSPCCQQYGTVSMLIGKAK
jgi:hypothetical protein